MNQNTTLPASAAFLHFFKLIIILSSSGKAETAGLFSRCLGYNSSSGTKAKHTNALFLSLSFAASLPKYFNPPLLQVKLGASNQYNNNYLYLTLSIYPIPNCVSTYFERKIESASP